MRPRLIFYLFLGLIMMASLRGEESPPVDQWDAVTVAPMKTSIYVGSVSLTSGEFHRDGDKFSAPYQAKVWPWFIWSETGQITITLTESDLTRLAKGERVEFTGHGMNHKKKPRKITGRIESSDGGKSGKIKVRVGVDDTELIFNGSYQTKTPVK